MGTLCILAFVCSTATAGFEHIERVDLGDGRCKDTYQLVHDYVDGQTTTLTDVTFTGDDLSYVAGWLEIESPDGWVFVISGPDTGWKTDDSDYGVEYTGTLLGFSVTTYYYNLVSSPIAISYGEEHDIDDWGAYEVTLLAVPEPTTLALLGIGAMLIRKRK